MTISWDYNKEEPGATGPSKLCSAEVTKDANFESLKEAVIPVCGRLYQTKELGIDSMTTVISRNEASGDARAAMVSSANHL